MQRKRISATECRRAIISGKTLRRHKYNARAAWRCRDCGGALTSNHPCAGCGGAAMRFDSQAEARYFDRLHQRLRVGEITDLRRRVPLPIVIDGQRIGTYYADFVYYDLARGRDRIVDVKGKDTDASMLKRKAVEAIHGIQIEVVQ